MLNARLSGLRFIIYTFDEREAADVHFLESVISSLSLHSRMQTAMATAIFLLRPLSDDNIRHVRMQ